MYDPSGGVLTFLAAGLSAAGSISAGIQQKKAADYNAQVLERDAQAAKIKAKYDEGMHRERVKQLLSKQKAAIGKSGLELSGSTLLSTLDTIEKGELDALAIRQGGEVSAQRSRSAASQQKMQGRAARTSSFTKAGTTLLTGAAKLQ